MLALRSKTGLTQVGLASYLGVTRHAVGQWEAGSSYPKSEHLKQFIALAFERRAFSFGHEAEEIRAFWQSAHQKLRVDESWLSELLASVTHIEAGAARRESAASAPTNEPRTEDNNKATRGLPSQPTPFVGRVAELAQIAQFLSDPECRLLTLLGPGGVGKTRLALAAAAANADAFADGIVYVPLASMNTSDQIVWAIGDALGLSFNGSPNPASHLFEHLQERRMLLVLDGFEHLHDGADVVSDIIERASRITLMVTSRARLNLQAEWLFEVEGLTFPRREILDVLTTTPQPVEHEKSRGPRVYWGDAMAVPTLYGREWEMNLLTGWVVAERCRVISVLGLGGIGKSALAVSLMHRVAAHFDVVIWRSLRDLPTCEVLLDDLLQVLNPQVLGEAHASVERRMGALLEHLRSTRVLVVLDNVESVLEEGEGAGGMRSGYEGFGRFLRQSAETEHQSCVLLTSREKPADLVALEGRRSPVRALRLARLDADACKQLLDEKDVEGSASERARLIEAYAGNPLALRIVAQTIFELFDGEIGPFLNQGEIIFGGVRELLDRQLIRLSALEQRVLRWLAILREPATLDDLFKVLATPAPRDRLLEAVEGLHRRSLIERGQSQVGFMLHSVVLEYATARLIAEASDEIREGKLVRLIEHGFELAHAREFVRQTQQRLIVAPILANLRSQYVRHDLLEAKLLAMLAEFAAQAEDAQGYGPANLVTLLRLQRGNLRGLDLSRLTLRGAYLQGVEMQDMSLAGATIHDSIFTETFDAMTAVAISGTGEYWAAASRRGEVLVWVAQGLSLHRMWRAHADMIWVLTFSPDGRTLASGSWDGAVKLWDVESGALVWSGRHTSHVNRLAFAPDGYALASCGNDATIRLWDARSGAQLQVLAHPAPVPVITWSPDGSLLASGDTEGSLQLWKWDETGVATYMETLMGHAAWVDGLVFAPDGRALASASWDGTVKLWDTSSVSTASDDEGLNVEGVSDRLRETLTAHTDRALRVAWSPDGRTLASSGRDKAIWLWDVEQRRYRSALRGHAAGVNGLAFTPDGHNLVSGSEDGTLRVWDIAGGQCLRIIQGHATSLYDIDWSPDGTQLVSGGTDYLVTIHSVKDGLAPRVLRGHIGVVFGVGWSPDGRRLASSEWDNAIRLWDPSSATCLQVLHHPDDAGNYFYGLAWSPDGQRLASGTYRRGVQVFEMTANNQGWVRREFPTWIRHVTWSPDGAQLAGGGDDGVVYVWDAADGTLLRRLAGHHGIVTRLAWSLDGTRLASGGSSTVGGELIVWDTQRGELERSFVGNFGVVYAVAWAPRGDVVVSGGSDGILRWWNVRSGECMRVQDAHEGTVQSLRRSPDGAQIASCGNDGAIMLWDLNTGAHLQTLRRDRPYERLNITGIKGLTAAQKATLRALGAVSDE